MSSRKSIEIQSAGACELHYPTIMHSNMKKSRDAILLNQILVTFNSLLPTVQVTSLSKSTLHNKEQGVAVRREVYLKREHAAA